MDKKEQARVRKQRQRDKERQNSVTSGGVTSKRDMVEKPRYLTLSDGQVLDREKQPVAKKTLYGMEAVSRVSSVIINQEKADRYKAWKEGEAVDDIGKVTAAKLLLICKSLDKTTLGLDGERVNLLSMVRYGVAGPTLESVKACLQ